MAQTGDLERFLEWRINQYYQFVDPLKIEKKSEYPAQIQPKELADYIVHLADKKGNKYGTIYRAITSIKKICEQSPNGYNPISEEVKQILRGLKREKGIAQKRAKAILWSDLVAILGTCQNNAIEYRNKILLLVGWFGALRRSEISNLQLQDIEVHDQGIVITIRQSKTDQVGAGKSIVIPPCNNDHDPYGAIVDYIKKYHRYSSKKTPFFPRLGVRYRNTLLLPQATEYQKMSGHAINEVIKFHGKFAGYSITAHSLRRGIITELAKNGIYERHIMKHSRHKSIETLRKYIDDGTIFETCPISQIFDRKAFVLPAPKSKARLVLMQPPPAELPQNIHDWDKRHLMAD